MKIEYEFPVVIEKDEDNMLIASVPTLPECHTQAKTFPTLMKRIKEAISLCLEVRKDLPHSRFIGLREIKVTLSR